MKEVRLTLPRAIALANLKRAERGQKVITMNSLAAEIGVATTTSTTTTTTTTTIIRLVRTDDKAATSLPLDLAGKS